MKNLKRIALAAEDTEDAEERKSQKFGITENSSLNLSRRALFCFSAELTGLPFFLRVLGVLRGERVLFLPAANSATFA
jgi:hypothetical protein